MISSIKKLKSKPQFLLAVTGACSSPNIIVNLTQLKWVWGHAKQYTRRYWDYTFAGLEKTIGPAIGQCLRAPKSFNPFSFQLQNYDNK